MAGVDRYDVLAVAGLALTTLCLWAVFGVVGPAALGVLVGIVMTLLGVRGGR